MKMKNKRRGKSREGLAEKEERLVEKLKRRAPLVATKSCVGPFSCTPVKLWTSHLSTIIIHNPSHSQEEPPSFFASSSGNSNNTATVSARKLGACLWEFHHYFPSPLSKMHGRSHAHVSNGGAADSRIRRHQKSHHLFKDKGLDLSHLLADHASPSSPEQPDSASSLRRHIAATLIQHHRAIERNNRALQPVSPASYGSSMEMAPYNPAITPSSSLDFKGRIGESHYSLKTSTELLKVLNRIWSLEEQHASNMALIKALKTELDHARIRIKELLRDQQANRHEIDDLMKKIAEEKIVRKSKEQERLYAAIQSLKDELEDERKLRKRSESLHRKLVRELTEVKSSFSNALKEMERERKSRKLLEDLCDEFARGIKEYEQEVHALKQKPDKEWVGRANGDHLILHISESWLDERMQMRLEEAQHGFSENNSIVEKLGFEIESFLEAKQIGNSKRTDNILPRERRNSMESVPLNEAVSAPQDLGDEEDSVGGDSQCFELNKPSNGDATIEKDEPADDHIDQTVKPSRIKKKSASRERTRGPNPSSLQVKFEEQMAWAMSCNGNNKSQVVDTEAKTVEGNTAEMSMSRKSEICDPTEGGSLEKISKANDIHGSSSNYVMDNLIRSHISSSEVGNLHLDNDTVEASCSYPPRRNASPVRQWMSKLTTPDLDISEPSTKPPPSSKENTLKAKLLEARTKGHRSRLKIFKGFS